MLSKGTRKTRRAVNKKALSVVRDLGKLAEHRPLALGMYEGY